MKDKFVLVPFAEYKSNGEHPDLAPLNNSPQNASPPTHDTNQDNATSVHPEPHSSKGAAHTPHEDKIQDSDEKLPVGNETSHPQQDHTDPHPTIKTPTPVDTQPPAYPNKEKPNPTPKKSSQKPRHKAIRKIGKEDSKDKADGHPSTNTKKLWLRG